MYWSALFALLSVMLALLGLVDVMRPDVFSKRQKFYRLKKFVFVTALFGMFVGFSHQYMSTDNPLRSLFF